MRNVDGGNKSPSQHAGVQGSTPKETLANQCPESERTFREPNELREHRKCICARLEEGEMGEEQANKEPTHSEPPYDEQYYHPIDEARWKQRTGTNTSANNQNISRYMAKPGQPRQPKRTQENKKKARYDTKQKQRHGIAPNVRKASQR